MRKQWFIRMMALALWVTGIMLPLTSSAQSLSEELIQQADIIVDINGNGDYATVQEGINAIPDYNDEWLVLLVRKGTYHEKVILNHKKTKVILVGEDVDSTIITHDDWGDKMLPGGHTFSTYTFRADPHDFQAYNITFENPTRKGQGVAYHSNGDRQILYHCRLIGYQDTYFDNFRTRRYIKDCFIEGRTDYIFGFGVTLFDSCQIHMVDNSGWMTAASTPEYYEFGYVFRNCRLTASPGVTSFYLGRPWFPYSNTIFFESWEPESLIGKGWDTWSGRENTCIYQEYDCFGPGSDTSERVFFGKQLDPELAPRYNTDTILAASNFPSDMGELVDSMELWSMRNRFEDSGYPERADTILYAGRDYYPEYPTANWSPEFYDPIHSVVTGYTVPFMDSINGVLEIEDLLWNGNPLPGFHPDSLEYVLEIPAEDTVPPVFKATGEGATTTTTYSAGITGTARVNISSRDKTSGETYKVYISQDSSYWSPAPDYFVFNHSDTMVLEEEVYHYDYYLGEGYSRVSFINVYGPEGLKYAYDRPDKIPGDLLITTVAPSGTDTSLYTVTVYFPLGIAEEISPSFLEVLNPVGDRIILQSAEAIPSGVFFSIYDLNGRLILSKRVETIHSGLNDLPLGTQNIKPGVYLYHVHANGRSASGKLVKSQ